jgi:hypothetical protein
MEYSLFPTKKAADKWAAENISGMWFIQKLKKNSWKLSYRADSVVQFPFYKEER